MSDQGFDKTFTEDDIVSIHQRYALFNALCAALSPGMRYPIFDDALQRVMADTDLSRYISFAIEEGTKRGGINTGRVKELPDGTGLYLTWINLGGNKPYNPKTALIFHKSPLAMHGVFLPCPEVSGTVTIPQSEILVVVLTTADHIFGNNHVLYALETTCTYEDKDLDTWNIWIQRFFYNPQAFIHENNLWFIQKIRSFQDSHFLKTGEYISDTSLVAWFMKCIHKPHSKR